MLAGMKSMYRLLAGFDQQKASTNSSHRLPLAVSSISCPSHLKTFKSMPVKPNAIHKSNPAFCSTRTCKAQRACHNDCVLQDGQLGALTLQA
jgi:hypothetical protein